MLTPDSVLRNNGRRSFWGTYDVLEIIFGSAACKVSSVITQISDLLPRYNFIFLEIQCHKFFPFGLLLIVSGATLIFSSSTITTQSHIERAYY